MTIDWFTIGAQVLNFLILVWLLKHFLYKPVLQAIAAREKRISDELADAKTKKDEAQKEHDEFNRKNEEFDKQRAELLKKAADDANAEGQRLREAARKAATALSVKLQETMANDSVHLNQTISRRIEKEVFAIARKALTDLAGAELEERMVDAFIQRLKGLGVEEKRKLIPSVQSQSLPFTICSAFDLSQGLRTKIENAAKEVLGFPGPIRFETNADLVGGIELTANGQKLAWSISGYLSSLEKITGVGVKIPSPETKPGPPKEAQEKADVNAV